MRVMQTNPFIDELAFERHSTAGIDRESVSVPRSDLWAFSCMRLRRFSDGLPTARPPEILAGMSSAPLRIDDEIWQFSRTSVAIIARPEGNGGYTFVARAYIITKEAWSTSRDRRDKNRKVKLIKILDWTKEQSLGPGHEWTKTVNLDPFHLLQMMKWVDLATG